MKNTAETSRNAKSNYNVNNVQKNQFYDVAAKPKKNISKQ